MKFIKILFECVKLVFIVTPRCLFHGAVKYWPGEMRGDSIRRWYYRLRFYAFGEGSQILEGCEIYGDELISLGRASSVGRFSELNAGPGPKPSLVIGDDTWIGPYAFFRTANHRFDDPDVPFIRQGHGEDRTIKIGNNVYAGAHCIFLPGVEVGDCCVIAAGSVVSGVIPSYSVVVGNPARVVRKRK